MSPLETSFTHANSTTIPVVVGDSNQGEQKRFATTEAQLEVWLSSLQSVEANCAYNEISSLVFDGELVEERIQKAIVKVIERNDLLRATFSKDGQEVIVHASPEFSFEFVDFSGKDVESLTNYVVEQQAHTPFDLENGPLIRFVLQKLGQRKYKLTFTAHHAILDGWSLAVFVRDLGYFYDVLGGKPRETLPPADQYDNYAEKMEAYFDSDQGKADEAFWVDQFNDQIPVLDLPIVSQRPALRTYSGDRYDHYFSADLVERVRKVGAKSGCSLFNVMLAGFSAYVARLSGSDDFCIGIPTAGQAAMDQPELIGHCVNAMPLRTKVDTDQTFVEFMKASRNNLLDAFDHQRYSYGTLLRKLAPPRDPSRPPMLSVSFNVDPMIDTSDLGFDGMRVDVLVEPRSFENFEWFINGVIQRDKSIEMQVQFNTDLYTKEAMQFYFEGFEAFLEGVAADPEQTLTDFPVMSVAQRQRVIADWNQNELQYPEASTLASEFTRQASETPDRIAVSFAGKELTYAEVEKQSNQIARYLQSQGIEAGDLVGICVERSDQMLVNLFAILKAGAGYVPLDPNYPSERLQYMCDHSGLKLIVTQSSLARRVGEFGKPQLAVDSAEDEIASLDSSPVLSHAKTTDICYVIYTSGSTGKPKGVQVPHGAVVNFLYAMKEKPGFKADDSILAVTTLSFDIAVLELYLPTLSGGKVVILDAVTAADGVKLAEQLEQHDISLLQATPATWRLMIQSGWDGKPGLKVLCGGEPMPQDLVEPLLNRCGELWNMYGPTETTVWSAAYQIKRPDAPILIGKPVGNTQIYIFDKHGNEVPVGCEGEVYIGGAGVTLGYRNRQDLTDERFVENRYRNPFANYVSDRLYKTGDLAKYRFDGNIQFLRRNDKQVKVRGFRIELGEIEQNLKSHPAVEQNVVIVREDTAGDARLVAYVVVKQGMEVTGAELRDHVRESVPYYMVPQHVVQLDSMPQTNNGKIDYKALPVPTLEQQVDASQCEEELPSTPAQKYLASVWRDVLDDDVYLNDMFFDIGGHSLLVMKVISAVEEKTGIRLGPQEFLVATLEQMADKLEASEAFSGFENSEPVPVDEKVEERIENMSDEPVNFNSDAVTNRTSELENPEKETSKGVIRKLKGFWS